MRQVLCYGDSNTWGCIPLVGAAAPTRFPPGERWPGVLRQNLGPDYWVVEAGLNGRTTVWDDGLEPHRNGRSLLLPTLLSHQPLDVVVVMLGTNDLKRRFGVSAAEIAEAAGMLVDIVRTSGCGPAGVAPHVLLVCPPPLGRLQPEDEEEFEGADQKSALLADRFKEVAESRGCGFVDAGAHVSSSDIDGIHLDREAHATLGRAVTLAVRSVEPAD